MVNIILFFLPFEDLLIIKPYLSIGIGTKFNSNFGEYGSSKKNCNKRGFFSVEKSIFSYASLGLLIGKELFNINFEIKYQVWNPKITYEETLCSISGEPLTPVEHTERINLSMLVWSVGLNIYL